MQHHNDGKTGGSKASHIAVPRHIRFERERIVVNGMISDRYNVIRIEDIHGLTESKQIGHNLSRKNAAWLIDACREVEAILTLEGK